MVRSASAFSKSPCGAVTAQLTNLRGQDGYLGMTVRRKTKWQWPRGMNRQVLLLGMISLLADVAGEMLTPVIPIFLTTMVGASATDVGLIEGVAEGLASLLKSASGAWSDRIRRRRPFIIAGYLMAAIAKPWIGLAHFWPQVLAARAVDRIGKGLRGAPRDAMLADAVEPQERARAFGWHRALDTTGAVIGPLLALLFIHRFQDDLRPVFFIAFIPGILAVALVWFLKDAPPREDSMTGHDGVSSRRKSALPPVFVYYLAFWALFCLGNSSDAFLILRAKNLGYSTSETILLYCLYNVVYAAASPSLGGLADRWGKKPVLSLGLIVFAFVYAGFAFNETRVLVIPLFAIYGLFAAATDGVGKSLAVDYLPSARRAFGLGVLGAVTGLTALASSVLGGWLWDTRGPMWTFGVGAILSLAAALAIGLMRERRTR